MPALQPVPTRPIVDRDTPPKPPKGLAVRGRRLWRTITTEFVLDGREVELLELACRTADDADRLTEALAQSSSVLVEGSKGQPVVNPLEREVRDTRNALARLLAALALPTDGGWDNLTASQRARKAARARYDR